MIADPTFCQNLITAAIETAGSPVALPDGSNPPAVKITSEREMLKVMRIEGELPDKVTTVFQFTASQQGVVVKGISVIAPDGYYLCDMIHIEQIAGITQYIAAGCYIR